MIEERWAQNRRKSAIWWEHVWDWASPGVTAEVQVHLWSPLCKKDAILKCGQDQRSLNLHTESLASPISFYFYYIISQCDTPKPKVIQKGPTCLPPCHGPVAVLACQHVMLPAGDKAPKLMKPEGFIPILNNFGGNHMMGGVQGGVLSMTGSGLGQRPSLSWGGGACMFKRRAHIQRTKMPNCETEGYP